MSNTTGKRPRLAVTLSPAMRIALDVLAARHNLPPSTEATMILRQALARTIETPEVRDAIARYNADRGVRSWREDMQLDHEVESRYATIKAALPGATE